MSARERFAAWRRSLPRAPRLSNHRITARGLEFAVFMTPAVNGATPLACVNGGLIYGHRLLWPALSPLAERRQLIFWDQRGRGESQAPPGPRAARIEHDAGDVAALREAIGLRQWDLLGHSWGGGIAMLGAERDRTGVRRLVLVDSVGPTSSWLPHLHDAALQRLSPSDRVLLQRLNPADLTEPSPGVHSAYSRAIYPAWFGDADLAQLFAPPRSESATGSAVAARLRREGYDWRALVRGLQVASLVLHGERDLLPPSVARELVALIPGSRLELIPGAGHMPFWESPERFFSAVSQFLDLPAA
ncbi:MAG: alpha/beta fold hydrolase [Gemmatimonadaceae bacterium]|nr:alpha/beta fold hydrolase [Gemmatimonadaceae bacterium]